MPHGGRTIPWSASVQSVTRCGAPVRPPRTRLTAGWFWECSQRAPPCSGLGLSWPSGHRSWRRTRRWACGWVWRRTGRSGSPPWWRVWRGGSCSRCALWRGRSCRWPAGGESVSARSVKTKEICSEGKLMSRSCWTTLGSAVSAAGHCGWDQTLTLNRL